MERFGYPSIDKFLDCESATFKHLLSSQKFSEALANNVDDIWRANATIQAFKKSIKDKAKNRNKKIKITPEIRFEACLENKYHDIRLSSIIEFENAVLVSSSQVIEIYGNRELNQAEKIIYRIHFDVALPGEKNKHLHPLYHMQIGGESNRNVQFVDEHSLSLPRIPYRPMSSALFWDMAFRELGTEKVKEIIEEGAWREIVRNNEEMIYYSFVEEICKRKRNKHDFVLSDLYYEK